MSLQRRLRQQLRKPDSPAAARAEASRQLETLTRPATAAPEAISDASELASGEYSPEADVHLMLASLNKTRLEDVGLDEVHNYLIQAYRWGTPKASAIFDAWFSVAPEIKEQRERLLTYWRMSDIDGFFYYLDEVAAANAGKDNGWTAGPIADLVAAAREIVRDPLHVHHKQMVEAAKAVIVKFERVPALQLPLPAPIAEPPKPPKDERTEAQKAEAAAYEKQWDFSSIAPMFQMIKTPSGDVAILTPWVIDELHGMFEAALTSIRACKRHTTNRCECWRDFRTAYHNALASSPTAPLALALPLLWDKIAAIARDWKPSENHV